jgi:hypothetical protein
MKRLTTNDERIHVSSMIQTRGVIGTPMQEILSGGASIAGWVARVYMEAIPTHDEGKHIIGSKEAAWRPPRP